MVIHRSFFHRSLVVAAFAMGGCKDPRVTDYRIPKETPAPPAQAAGAASASGDVNWQAPADWKPQPSDGVRKGSYLVTGAAGAQADMSVTSFPGDVGGDLANLNRWRGQAQLPPVGEGDLSQAFTAVNGPAGDFLVADIAGTSAGANAGPFRILGAIFKQPDQTWFFKLAGNSELVESQKPAFVAFIKSVEVNPGGTTVTALQRPENTNDLPPDARGPLPPGHPAIGPNGGDMANTPVVVASGLALTWTAPASWTPRQGSAMRKGTYQISGPEGTADLAITAFPGDVGGNLANVNRWRGQLGLDPVASVEGALEPLSANGLQMLVFDGANQGTRMLGAIVPRDNETWFFKMTGPDALVARSKPDFLAFLRTVKPQ